MFLELTQIVAVSKLFCACPFAGTGKLARNACIWTPGEYTGVNNVLCNTSEENKTYQPVYVDCIEMRKS